MKKFILMMLVMVGGVLSASADDPVLEFHFNYNDTWSGASSYPTFTSLGTNPDNSSEIIYEFTISKDNGLQNGRDIYFRLHYQGWANDIGPASNFDYSLSSNITGNYYQWHGEASWTNDKYYKILHSSIKAGSYTIRVKAQQENHYDIHVTIGSMPASVSSLNYATFSCNRTLDFTDVTDVTAYRASSVTDGKVVLTKVTGKVPASTGLLLKADGETATTIPVIPTEEIDFGTNLLIASVTATEVEASTSGTYHYFLAGSDTKPVGFYNLAADKTSGAGKAYLETSTELSTSSNARAEWSFEDNEATGIQLINTNKQETFFDLQGRAVKHLTNGLYIKNGKKVIVK